LYFNIHFQTYSYTDVGNWQLITVTGTVPISGVTSIRAWIRLSSSEAGDIALDQGDYVEMTAAMLTIGKPRQFEPRSLSLELLLCQRYYEKSYPIATPPGSDAVSDGCLWIPERLSVPHNSWLGFITYRITKYKIPTITMYSWSGNPGRCSNTSGVEQGANSALTVWTGTNNCVIRNYSGVTISSSGGWICHYTADAEF